MDKLIEGFRFFRKNIYPQKETLFKQLSTGQDPKILFITCSDSRIALHQLTNTEPGDLFVVRNAGNIIPAYDEHAAFDTVIGSISYAVKKLNIEEIIICSHHDCGAMKALINPASIKDDPELLQLLSHAHKTKEKINEEKIEDLSAVIKLNASMQAENLKTYPFIQEKLTANQIKIHVWFYDLAGNIYSVGQDGTYTEVSSSKNALNP